MTNLKWSGRPGFTIAMSIQYQDNACLTKSIAYSDQF